jgi:cytochrome b561
MRSAHAALYVILIVMAITGYLGTHQSAGFYLFIIPSFRDTAIVGWFSSTWHFSWEEFEKSPDAIHRLIGKRLAWLIVSLHVAAALLHHWIRRDGTLTRMLPGARNAQG